MRIEKKTKYGREISRVIRAKCFVITLFSFFSSLSTKYLDSSSFETSL